jgi:hypothetical protein
MYLSVSVCVCVSHYSSIITKQTVLQVQSLLAPVGGCAPAARASASFIFDGIDELDVLHPAAQASASFTFDGIDELNMHHAAAAQASSFTLVGLMNLRS